MATSIATHALQPKTAVLLSGILNLIGAFLSVEVALTVTNAVVKIQNHDGTVREIAAELAGLADQGEEITVVDIEKLINDATLDEASPADVSRVSAHLAAGGWPLADRPL